MSWLPTSSLSEIKEHLVYDFDLVLDPVFGADQTGGRLAIRQHIKTKYSNHSSDEILDLDTIPKMNIGFVSIAHTQGLGGYVYSAKAPIGLDLEVSARVTAKTVSRISNGEELKMAPSPDSLWVAKEAIFKALRNQQKQPQLLSQIETFWQPNESSQVEIFYANKASNLSLPRGKGCVIRHDKYSLAIFVLDS